MTASPIHEPVRVVIPTRNRHTELRRCLESLVSQTIAPDMVVVCDASDSEDSATVCADVSAAGVLPVLHLPARAPGLTAQRNCGLSALPDSCGFVLFLDDDVILSSTYVERLLTLFEEHAEVVGASGIATQQRETSTAPLYYRSYTSLFCLSSMRRQGVVLASGVNTPPPAAGPPVEAEWLFGCAMYRSRLFEELSFDESLTGYGLSEDVDFSMRASKYGALMVDPCALLDHRRSPNERLDVRAFERVSARNRHWLMRRHRPGTRSSLAYWWSMLGLSILYVSRMRHEDEAKSAIERFRGLLEGVADVARRR